MMAPLFDFSRGRHGAIGSAFGVVRRQPVQLFVLRNDSNTLMINLLWHIQLLAWHNNDVIMSEMASEITSLKIVYSSVCSRADKKTSKLSITGLCEGISPVTGEFLAQRTSNTNNISIWWRHHGLQIKSQSPVQRNLSSISRAVLLTSLTHIAIGFQLVCAIYRQISVEINYKFQMFPIVNHLTKLVYQNQLMLLRKQCTHCGNYIGM